MLDMRVVSLGSGSSGNALLVEAGPQGRTKLLVDAGLSGHTLVGRLRRVQVDPAQLQGVLVTHEHSDHIIGLPLLAKYYNIPIVIDPRTYKAIGECLVTGIRRSATAPLVMYIDDATEEAMIHRPSLPEGVRMQAMPVGTHCTIGDIEVTSFPISHDAVAPCGYLLKAGGCRVCVITDTGEVTPAMLEHIQHADLLILEANHDRERLLRGPYSWALKQRILSSTGHLSNAQAAEAVLRTWRSDSIRWLWLAHLSKTNNTPALALSSVRTYLRTAKVNLAQIHISTAPPNMGLVWDSTQLWQASSLWEMQM